MLLKNVSSLNVSCDVKEGSVQFVHQVIPEDPVARHDALVNVVLLYCSNVLFPGGKVVANSNHTYNDSPNGDLRKQLSFKGEEGNATLENLCVERLSGGITNELFRVYNSSHCSHSVVVRCFGKETERVISRESELFYQSVFIPTYVRGTNFLIYKFFSLYETLPFEEMPLESTKIATAISSFHVRATLEARCDYHRPLLTDEERVYWDAVGPTLGSADASLFNTCRFDREENYTLHALTTWVEQIFSEGILRKVKTEKRAEYEDISRQLQRETPWMLELLQRHAPSLGECVCHNDLLSANIMRHRDNGSLKIIDFDYVKRNYFLFDIANHFNEYTGLECNYAKYFPSDEDMAKFIIDYRKAIREELKKQKENVRCRELKEIIPDQEYFFMFGMDDANEEQRTITHWVQLVKLLTLASHLCWSVWSLLQEAVSELDVDFLAYSKLRLARYLETKDIFSVDFI